MAEKTVEVRAIEEEIIIGINGRINETPILLVVFVLFSIFFFFEIADGDVKESRRRFVIHTVEEIDATLRTQERRGNGG
jgi:hypothetical protein